MPLSINELKTGVTISIDNDAYVIINVEHVKPGKGAAFVRTKMKNLKNGNLIERTFKTDDKLQDAFVEQRELEYLYNNQENFHFMDHETYEDLTIGKDILSDKINFLKENLIVTGTFFQNKLISVVLPNFIDFKILSTEPGLKGDTAKSTGKPATIETGAIVSVPLFINPGDIVRIDTRTGGYVGRA